jgi:hypothetical protein
MYRKEMLKLGQPLERTFKGGSVNDELVRRFIRQNNIDEKGYIDFALSLDSSVTNFCRQQGYKSNDFLTGKIFEEAPEQMMFSVSAPERSDGKKIWVTRKVDMSMFTNGKFMLWAPLVRSRKIASEVLLPVTLNAINDARDMRLLACVYKKYGGFSNKSDPQQKPILYSQSLNSRLKSEFINRNIGRIGSRRDDSADDIVHVVYGLERRGLFKPGAYGEPKAFASSLVVFMRNSELLTKEYRKTLKRRGYVGLWLNLLD